jgi:membrane protease subunit HflC
MKKILLFSLAAVIIGGFLVFMMTFTVRFTETAVVTTFGRAGENSVVDSPGLKFKWPTPVQSVTVYDTRARLLETREETQQTADQRQLVIGAFLTWRVEDPLAFYQAHREEGSSPSEHYRKAEKNIESLFRSALAEVSRYRLDELFATGDTPSSLPGLEAAMLSRMTSGQADAQGYGVAVEFVGIKSIELPSSATSQVMEQMKKEREKIAADAESQGEARAQAIRASAEDDAERIRSFVRPAAAELEAQGDAEAARWLAQMAEAPELAIFLEQVRLLREGFGRKATIVLPTTFPGLQLLDLDRLSGLSADVTGADPR